MISSRIMSQRRSPPSRRTFCPSCDAPLAPDLAESPRPTCRECGTLLVPAQVASGFRRLAAGLVDLAILLATAAPLNWLLLTIVDPPSLLGRAVGLDAALRLLELDPADLLLRLAPFFGMTVLYFGLFWALRGQTLGGRLLGVRVIDLHGDRPSPARSAIRALTHVLGLLAGALGWIWAAFDFERRAWHDHSSGTYVVREL